MAMRKRSPIDRRFAVTAVQAETSASRLPMKAIIFVDAWGKPEQCFDFNQLTGLPADLSALLADAFREHCAGQRLTTRRTTWNAIRRFARFVADDGMIDAARNIDTAALGRYVLWLKKESVSRAGRGAHAIAFDLLRPLLIWCQRNRPAALPLDLEIPWNAFPDEERTSNRDAVYQQDSLRRYFGLATRRSMKLGRVFSMVNGSCGFRNCRPRPCAVKGSIDGSGELGGSKVV